MKRLLTLLCLAALPAAASPDIFGAIAGNDISLLKTFVAEDPSSATNAAKKGMTPLHYAASLDRQEAAYLLLKAGVSPDILAPASQTTPLHWAADANAEDVLRLLIRSKATIDARAKHDLTPLHLAARRGSVACIVRLLEAKADPNAVDDAGNTPLHAAVARGRAEAVTALLKRGADPSLANKLGQTAAALATDPATLAALGVPSAPAEPGQAPAPAATAPSAAAAAAFTAADKTPAERYELFAADPATVRLADNTLYNGGWSHGRFEGQGVHVINAEGERYEGAFHRGRRDGRGRYVYPNGDVLECEWDDDVPDGAGSFTFGTGGTVRGTWKNGVLREGSGTFSTTSGAQSFGFWRDGNLVSSQPVSR